MPIAGKLSDELGRRVVLLGGVTVFGAASLLALGIPDKGATLRHPRPSEVPPEPEPRSASRTPQSQTNHPHNDTGLPGGDPDPRTSSVPPGRFP